jgi:CheY-like chemotaxis protein
MPTMLIVDDCRPIADILARYLSSAGHKVTITADGAGALAAIAQNRPDCVLLDLMMPGMTGMELLHTLNGDPSLADLPVVLVSSRVGEGRTHLFAERDANVCVGKPFTRLQVLEAVATVLRERAPRAGRSAA